MYILVCTSMYQYVLIFTGIAKPSLGGLTIDETFDRQEAARKALDVHRKETHGRHKDDSA